MHRDTAIAWASRIIGQELTEDDICLVWQLIETKVKPFGSRFSYVGEVGSVEFMVVTRRAVFRRGYLGMDPAEILQFHEGEKERIARKLLEEEGLGHLEFATRLDTKIGRLSFEEPRFDSYTSTVIIVMAAFDYSDQKRAKETEKISSWSARQIQTPAHAVFVIQVQAQYQI
ncbi:uncharacterized protein EV420DRAFT_1745847 [Desarmillaria tabescens]|uniref:Uncharacterized protein n=1 Tax=Armillaria tabescens TaxID=1929756 RepID=A0AA39NB91_ARMTA|nr:uncharacterized protein EV420DRAFT_1745847 [Desarmillaria tabescens]KAK0462438.1 hypothetical protein EV420DRAFT_1745847 [Desarmillaria tabescens]